MSSSERLVGRERIWVQSLEADPKLSLNNLCHPADIKLIPLKKFSLGDLVLPCGDENAHDGRSQLREFVAKSFFRTAQTLPMTDSSCTTLLQVEKVLSSHYRLLELRWDTDPPSDGESDRILRHALDEVID